jgi:hypothetical protein
VIAGIAMVMTVLAIQILLYDEFLLPAYAVAGFMVYLVMLRLLKAVRKEDILLLESYFGGRLNLVTRLLARILL